MVSWLDLGGFIEGVREGGGRSVNLAEGARNDQAVGDRVAVAIPYDLVIPLGSWVVGTVV